MTVKKLKEVKPSSLQISEDEYYQYYLTRSWYGEGEKQVLHLWQVVLNDNSTHFILAEDEQGAISQCTVGAPTWEGERKLEKGAFAIQLPMRIRGWSNNIF